jgi:hypothetical protein
VKWYAYLGYFFAGTVLANSVPHFVQGISGQEFPTPFGDPSLATLNVLWCFANLAVGYSIATARGGLVLPSIGRLP